jgi:hypothetical protein
MECQSRNPECRVDALVYVVLRCCKMAPILNLRNDPKPCRSGQKDWIRLPTISYDEHLKFPQCEDETAQEAFDADEQVLFGVLPQFCAIARDTGSLLCKDELIRGLRDVFRGGQISLWLAFAAQIFIDSHHLLRQKLEHGFQKLEHQGQQMMRNVQEHFAFHKHIDAKWLEDTDQLLQTTVALQIKTAVFQHMASWTFMNFIGPAVPQPTQFHLFKRHPLLCGPMIYLICSQLYAISIPFLSILGASIMTAHLRNTTIQEGYFEYVWDMERFVHFHDLFKVVVTEKGACLSRFFFAIDGKISKIADDGRKVKGKPATVSGLAGALSDVTPVLELFKHRYEQDGNRPPVDNQTPAQKNRFIEKALLNSSPCSTNNEQVTSTA